MKGFVTLKKLTLSQSYAPKALSEYKAYLARYYQWENDGGTLPVRPVPLASVLPKPPLVKLPPPRTLDV